MSQNGSRMSRVAPTIALLGVAALLASCGKGSGSAPSKQQPSASNSRLSRAHAQSYIGAVNLTAADVPGFTVSSSKKEAETPAEKRFKRKLEQCVHPVSSKSVGEGSSPEFTRELGLVRESVQSEVTVTQSPVVATRELALIRSRRARSCVLRYFSLLVKAQQRPGSSFGHVSLVQRTPPAPGADGSFAWRISVAITVRRVTVPLYFDVFGFIVGANEVSMFASGLPLPFPPHEEANLFSLLLERAKAPAQGGREKHPGKKPKVTTS
jgi:hypothetical protein